MKFKMGSDSDNSDTENNTMFPNQNTNDAESFCIDDYGIHTNKSVGKDTLGSLLPGHADYVDKEGGSHEVNIERDSGSYYGSMAKTEEIEAVSTKYTKRQLLIFFVYSFTEFCTGAIVSIQAPFYPAEAEKKGLVATEYGAVFGVFEFTVFVASFIYGKYMSYFGPKFVFNMGLLVAGVTCILFGMLDRVEGRTLFYALSMSIRIVEALAAAACLNAAFTIIALEFPKSVATTFATMETLYAVGLIGGPIIGGALFELGGFPLPFFSCGILLLLVSILTFFVLPTPVDTNEANENSKGLLQLFQIPEVTISAIVIFSGSLTIGYLEATLEPHIRMFNLSFIAVGFVIVISGGTYALLAPFWGKLCDRWPRLDLYMLIGCILIIIGFVLIGPAPFLPFDTILWVTCVGLGLQGIGLGGCLVGGFLQCLTSASSHGFPDNVSTYGMISGIWASMFSLGNFVGPTVSGVLYDGVGFRNGTLFVIGLMFIVIIALGSMMIFRKKSKHGYTRRLSQFTETDPLIPKI